MALEPIRHELVVRCSTGRTFETYLGRIGADRKKFGDWRVILARFAALAETEDV